jgi:hypothetical protein
MSLKKINTVLVAAFMLFILWFGTEFILGPETTAPGFGLPSWPSGDGGGFLIIKGIRDVVLALVLGILLVTGQPAGKGSRALVIGARSTSGVPARPSRTARGSSPQLTHPVGLVCQVRGGSSARRRR